MKLPAKQVAKLVAAAPYVSVHVSSIGSAVKVIKSDIIENLKFFGDDMVLVKMGDDGALYF